MMMIPPSSSSARKRQQQRTAIFFVTMAVHAILATLLLTQVSIRDGMMQGMSRSLLRDAPTTSKCDLINTEPADTDADTDAHDDDGMVHVVILSNRLVAMAVAIGSVCRTSNEKIHFHVFSTDKQEFHAYFDKLHHCKGKGSILDVQTIDEATDSLLRTGFEPIWWLVDQGKVNASLTQEEKKEWGVQTPYTNDKHAHALNLLRFYLPYIPSLTTLDKFVFLDDDVVLKRDIKEITHHQTESGIAMTAGCQHWMWNGNVAGDFETSWNTSVLETKYIGNHGVNCDSEQEQPYGCLLPTLERDLQFLSRAFDPNSKFANKPLDRMAFNMGLNVFNVKAWKELKLSHRFEQWVEASNNLKLFPLDTLSFGLCLAYLALGDTVQCYEPSSLWHLVGMAFISQEAYEASGWTLPKIHSDAYALHYNGADKPWEKVKDDDPCSTENPTSLLDMWKKACEDAGICSCKKVSSPQLTANSSAV